MAAEAAKPAVGYPLDGALGSWFTKRLSENGCRSQRGSARFQFLVDAFRDGEGGLGRGRPCTVTVLGYEYSKPHGQGGVCSVGNAKLALQTAKHELFHMNILKSSRKVGSFEGARSVFLQNLVARLRH